MKSIATILVAYCLTYFHDAHAKVNVLQKTYGDPEKRLVFGFDSYRDGRLAYALCDKNPPANEVNCTVIREKHPYSDDVYSCNVTIKRENGDAKYPPKIRLYQFGDRYVTLNSWDGSSWDYLRFTTVQMDSCKFVETKFNVTPIEHYYDVTVVSRNNSFDVFHYSKRLPHEHIWGKVTIDAEGRVIAREDPSIIQLYEYATVAKRSVISLDDVSSAGGYFYVKPDIQDIDTLVKPDGTEISLAKHPWRSADEIIVSKKNNLIGVCRQTGAAYKCSQYDFEGNAKLHTSIARSRYDDKMLLEDVHNSPNGGFYIFSRDFSRHNKRYVIERIDANGSKSQPKAFEIPAEHLSYSYYQTPVFFENESKETCLSVISYKWREDIDWLYAVANCFTDADFK